MNAHPRIDGRSAAGFTLVEVMIAVSIFIVLIAMAIAAYTSTMRFASEGSTHVNFIDTARAAEQQILKYVQAGGAVGVEAEAIRLYMPDDTIARIKFEDDDGDPQTVADNRLVYDPNESVANNDVEICREVSPIDGEPMFKLVATSPRSVILSFHVGEVPPEDSDGSELLAGQGYQGVEVRVSATPRNQGTIYY